MNESAKIAENKKKGKVQALRANIMKTLNSQNKLLNDAASVRAKAEEQ